MSLFFILLIVVLGNWLLSNLFVFLPISLLGQISSWSWLILGCTILLFLGWCLGDDYD